MVATKEGNVKQLLTWAPAVLMGIGALFTVGIDAQRSMSLETPLDSVIPYEIAGYSGRDIEMSDAEVSVAAPTAYIMRNYDSPNGPTATAPWFSVYIGYYERQMRGVTIHSPKNCLPGSGWEALASEAAEIAAATGAETVNRYMLQREGEQALVLYWYQGRGRVESNEYVVKLDLLWDAATRRRSEEALVRIVVPVAGTDDEVFGLASRVAATIMPSLVQALPGW
jgi:EpsI family protein